MKKCRHEDIDANFANFLKLWLRTNPRFCKQVREAAEGWLNAREFTS